MRLDGLAIDGSSGGGVTQLGASFTGGDTQQDGLALVSSSVAVTGGEAPYTYAVTLRDPRGVDRSALLSSTTSASPTFTPDLTGGGGVWLLRVTVTDSGGRTATAAKAVTVGQNVGAGSPWVQAFAYESDGTTDASVSAGSIAWAGLTWAAPNTGVEVVDGDLVLTNAAGSVDFGRTSGARTAPFISAALSTIAGLAALGDRQVLVIVDVESYAPSTSNEALRVALEQAGNPIGTGTSGRGVAGGQAFFTTLRAASIIYAEGNNGSIDTSATAASVGGVACLFAGGGVTNYTDTTAYTDAADVLVDAFKQVGGARPAAPITLDQFALAAAKPTAGAGATCTIRGLQVWVR